jgi:hypothetical protein
VSFFDAVAAGMAIEGGSQRLKLKYMRRITSKQFYITQLFTVHYSFGNEVRRQV